MLDSFAAYFLLLSRKLTEIERLCLEGALTDPDKTVLARKDPPMERMNDALHFAELLCSYLPLPSIIPQIGRLRADLSGGTVVRERLQRDVLHLYQRFKDELDAQKFLHVSPERIQYYRKKQLFGPEVAGKFPEAREDIENAGNCYALGQPTACVLHLMRAMEATVEGLSLRLGVTILPRDTWGRMLGKMDDKIKEMPEKTKPQKRKKARWSEARANLFHVKEAWRNESMHPRQTYTLDQARDVIEAVRTFMTGLAKL
ncbi:MAG TPA: hypothetical protein VEI03_15950 [Stellaceae bacterium]|nr:hypothetical protein [Stellaceae bacterium]